MAVNASSHRPVYHCSDTTFGVLVVLVFVGVKLLLLPLSLLVLHLGLWRRRQRRASAAASHSDVFAYHSAAVELVFALGATFYTCGQRADRQVLASLGYYLCCCVFPAETCLHMLTCTERYLAVVHPVLYLGLRRSGGVRVRNASVGCVWLLCLGWMGVTALYSPDFPYLPCLCFSAFALVQVSFCSLLVLRALIRPGPGEVGGNGAQVDQSKRRAFHTVTAILAVLCLCVLGFLVCVAVDSSRDVGHVDGCLTLLCGNFVALPSSVVLPLQFLHRARKLPCSLQT